MIAAHQVLGCELCGAVKTQSCRPICAVADCRICRPRRERVARGAVYCLDSARAKLAGEVTNPHAPRVHWLCNDCLLPVALPEGSRALSGTAQNPHCPCGGELCCCKECEAAARIVRSGPNVVERVRLARSGGVKLNPAFLAMLQH